jgi:anti-sigma factor (TIGR02949 family)
MQSERAHRRQRRLECSEVLANLGDFLDGELAPQTLAKVRAHVAACTACSRFGGAYASAVEALRRTPRESPLDAALIASIVAKAG